MNRKKYMSGEKPLCWAEVGRPNALPDVIIEGLVFIYIRKNTNEVTNFFAEFDKFMKNICLANGQAEAPKNV